MNNTVVKRYDTKNRTLSNLSYNLRENCGELNVTALASFPFSDYDNVELLQSSSSVLVHTCNLSF